MAERLVCNDARPAHGGSRALTSVPGVGPTTAATFLLRMFNPQRLNRPEEIASYLGLAPTVRYSGGNAPRGHLTSDGQNRLRSLLVEESGAWKSKAPYAQRNNMENYFHEAGSRRKQFPRQHEDWQLFCGVGASNRERIDWRLTLRDHAGGPLPLRVTARKGRSPLTVLNQYYARSGANNKKIRSIPQSYIFCHLTVDRGPQKKDGPPKWTASSSSNR